MAIAPALIVAEERTTVVEDIMDIMDTMAVLDTMAAEGIMAEGSLAEVMAAVEVEVMEEAAEAAR